MMSQCQPKHYRTTRERDGCQQAVSMTGNQADQMWSSGHCVEVKSRTYRSRHLDRHHISQPALAACSEGVPMNQNSRQTPRPYAGFRATCRKFGSSVWKEILLFDRVVGMALIAQVAYVLSMTRPDHISTTTLQPTTISHVFQHADSRWTETIIGSGKTGSSNRIERVRSRRDGDRTICILL
jgi:hypothetical protein